MSSSRWILTADFTGWQNCAVADRVAESPDLASETPAALSAGRCPANTPLSAFAAGPAAVRVLALQRASGNRATTQFLRGSLEGSTRVLARCPGRCTCGGKCGRHEEETDPIFGRELRRAVLARQVHTAAAVGVEEQVALREGASTAMWSRMIEAQRRSAEDTERGDAIRACRARGSNAGERLLPLGEADGLRRLTRHADGERTVFEVGVPAGAPLLPARMPETRPSSAGAAPAQLQAPSGVAEVAISALPQRAGARAVTSLMRQASSAPATRPSSGGIAPAHLQASAVVAKVSPVSPTRRHGPSNSSLGSTRRAANRWPAPAHSPASAADARQEARHQATPPGRPSVITRPRVRLLRQARRPCSGGRPVCGPDITDALGLVTANTIVAFGRWSNAEKSRECAALESYSSGATAWDVFELHEAAEDARLNSGQSWITREYRPECAHRRDTGQSCILTVQVGDECHYVGSVNYRIFGTMCRLCYDHLTDWRSPDAADFTQEEMEGWIRFYKDFPFASSNTRAAIAWAAIGYNARPMNVTPPGDRSTCDPCCPRPFVGSFHVHWHDHRDIGGSEGLAFPVATGQ